MANNFKKHIAQILSKNRFIYKFPVGKKVYLTFDDGPHERYTRQILSILKTFSVKSTFFLVGQNVEAHPQITAEIHNSGHAIGLHTYSHRRFDMMSRKDFKDEVIKNQMAIEQIIGVKSTILRPPEGRLKIVNLLWAIKSRVKIIHYTITSNDWKAKNIYDILKSIEIDNIKGGEIISFHDNNRHTVKALPIILEHLSEKQLCCVPIEF